MYGFAKEGSTGIFSTVLVADESNAADADGALGEEETRRLTPLGTHVDSSVTCGAAITYADRTDRFESIGGVLIEFEETAEDEAESFPLVEEEEVEVEEEEEAITALAGTLSPPSTGITINSVRSPVRSS